MSQTRQASLRALAKINLDLRVLHARPDGYHEIRTIFQTISLADIIDVEYTRARGTTIQIDGDVDIPDNLIAKAATLVLDAMRVTARVRFRLRKRIPMGAGLGGGSSDAAAVLLALPALAGHRLALPRLMELAAGLGSDVPFFLSSQQDCRAGGPSSSVRRANYPHRRRSQVLSSKSRTSGYSGCRHAHVQEVSGSSSSEAFTC